MTKEEDHSSKLRRRLILPVTAAPESPASFDLAVRLAAGMGLSLESVFMEDEGLIEFAALPFSCEITMSGRQTPSFTAETISRDLRVEASRVQRILDATARRYRAPLHFHTQRGKLADLLLSLKGPGDLLALTSGWRPSGEPESINVQWPSRPDRRSDVDGGGMVWLIGHSRRRRDLPVAVITGEGIAESSLFSAIGIAKAFRCGLRVIDLAPSGGKGAAETARASGRAGYEFSMLDETALAHAITMEFFGGLIAPERVLSESGLTELVERNFVAIRLIGV